MHNTLRKCEIDYPKFTHVINEAMLNETKGEQMESRLTEGFSQELLDLEKMYVDKIKVGMSRQKGSLSCVVDSMRRFIELYDDNNETVDRLEELHYKMGFLSSDTFEEDENE